MSCFVFILCTWSSLFNPPPLCPPSLAEMASITQKTMELHITQKTVDLSPKKSSISSNTNSNDKSSNKEIAHKPPVPRSSKIQTATHPTE